MTEVVFTGSAPEADLVRSLLESHGIRTTLLDEQMAVVSGALGVASPYPVQVAVHREDLEAARALIDQAGE